MLPKMPIVGCPPSPRLRLLHQRCGVTGPSRRRSPWTQPQASGRAQVRGLQRVVNSAVLSCAARSANRNGAPVGPFSMAGTALADLL